MAPRNRPRTLGSPYAIVLAGASALTALLAVILVSPLLLLRLLGDRDDWITMSNIGQAYGGISAVLSAAGLFGIGISVRLQFRQAALITLFDARQRHIEVMKMSIDDPELLQAVDPDIATSPHCRKIIYANLMMNSWFVNWKIGEMSDAQIRHYASRMFTSPIAREWWSTHRETWGIGLHRRDLAFVALVTQVWQQTVPRRRAVPGQRSPSRDEQTIRPPRVRAGSEARSRTGKAVRRTKPTKAAF